MSDMGHVARVGQLLSYWAVKAVDVLIEQFPFFVIYFSVLGGGWVAQSVYSGEPLTSVRTLGGVALLVLYSWGITALIAATGSRWLKAIAYILLILLKVTDHYLLVNFGAHLGPEPLRLLAETNMSEASEFLDAFVFGTSQLRLYVLLLSLIVVVLVGEWLRPRLARRLSHNWVRVLLGAIVVPFAVFGLYCCRIFVQMASCRTTEQLIELCSRKPWGFVPSDMMSNLIYSGISLHNSGAEMRHMVQCTRQLQNQQVMVTQHDSLAIVVVVGESFIKHHSSLYGYELETNPLLAHEREQGRLFVFDDVISPFNQTSTVLKHIFSCSDLAADEPWYASPFLPAVFHRAGYHVTMWDNQRTMYQGTTLSFALNAFLYHPVIVDASYDVTNRRSYEYDMQAVEALVEQTDVRQVPSLTIIHLLGQHIEPEERFPDQPEYRHFTTDSIRSSKAYLTPEKRQVIADYDNATRYNDMVVERICRLYAATSAVVVYFSDHGEEVYDYRDSCGWLLTDKVSPMMAKFQFQVPFMIWCSDRYRQSHPQVVEAIRRATARPMSLDRLPHMLLGLGHISAECYRPACDVLSNEWMPGRRLINDTIDYDCLMNTH